MILNKKPLKSAVFLFSILLLTLTGCSSFGSYNNSFDGNKINPGDDPNFTIVANTNKNLSFFNRQVNVFGLPIYALPGVEDKKLLHAANVLAQYLDNNEDGVVDNSLVLQKMIDANAALVMWKQQPNINIIGDIAIEVQDLGNDETVPNWHSNGRIGRFDASLEEVFHLITHIGYAKAYPGIFGESLGSSSITYAMDTARGGQFSTVPARYPAKAWYTYTDSTCDYECMTSEYFYWAMTSILGAQEKRLADIDDEWDLNTKALLQNTDSTVYNLLTDPQYKLPTILPDGTYKR